MVQTINRGDIARNRILTELLNRHFWETDEIQNEVGLQHEGQGQAVNYAHLVRSQAGTEIYLHYTVSRIPRFTERDRVWDIVPIHDRSWYAYLDMANRGMRTALLIFCPYHSRPLTCEYVGDGIFYRDVQEPQPGGRGSQMPFIDVDLSRFRTLPEFLESELQVPQGRSRPLLQNLLNEAREVNQLRVSHDYRSPYKGQEPDWLPW